jgi:transcriptional regulator with XRE-family HTH domain
MGEHEIDVGARLRIYRKKKDISLNRLAELTGIAASNLSSIELNKTAPTLHTLVKIAHAFDTRVGAFLDEVLYEGPSLVRYSEASFVATDTKGVTIRRLVPSVPRPEIDCLEIELDSSCEDFAFPRFDGHLVIHCTKGPVTVTVHDTEHRLESRDTLHIPEYAEILPENAGKETCRMLVFSRYNARD